MRTDAKTTPSSSAEESLQLHLPTSWEGLSAEQLEDVYHFSSELERSAEYVKTLLLMKWCQLSVASGKWFQAKPGCAWIRHGGKYYNVSVTQLTAATESLDFLDTPPPFPLRPAELHGHKGVNAELHGVLFGEYLALESYYQGFLQSKNPEALNRAATILYPGFEGELLPWERFALLLWLSGLKQLYIEKFPDLFATEPSTQSAEKPDMHAIAIAQLRALTGGDVTKMQAVRDADTWDALEELNGKAAEAREMKRIMKKK